MSGSADSAPPFADPAGPAVEAALAVDPAWWPRPARRAPLRPATDGGAADGGAADGGAAGHSMGVRRADPDTWLRPRNGDPALLGWKRALLDAAGPAATVVPPSTAAASAAVLGLVRHATGDRTPADADRHPLDAAGRLVVEDLCLLDVSGPAPVLVAASLAMPSRWRLADKLGRDLIGVHAPVPGYAAGIGGPTDRLLLRLGAERVVARTAWTITDDPRLFQPAAGSQVHHDRAGVRSPADAARLLHLRTEYQTLRRVPGHPCVLFTIRTARVRLGAIADHPDAAGRAADLLAVLEAMPPEHAEYKGLAPYRELVADWLRAVARPDR